MNKAWLKRWWGVPAGLMFLLVGIGYSAMTAQHQRELDLRADVGAARVTVTLADKLQGERYTHTGRYAPTVADLVEADGEAGSLLLDADVTISLDVSQTARTVTIRARKRGAVVTVTRSDGRRVSDSCRRADGVVCLALPGR